MATYKVTITVETNDEYIDDEATLELFISSKLTDGNPGIGSVVTIDAREIS